MAFKNSIVYEPLEKEEISSGLQQRSCRIKITEITDRIFKQYGPALLFENVKGSNYPVLINSMGVMIE